MPPPAAGKAAFAVELVFGTCPLRNYLADHGSDGLLRAGCVGDLLGCGEDVLDRRASSEPDPDRG